MGGSSVSVNDSSALAGLEAAAHKQIPFAIAQTLNQLAYEAARKKLPAEADRVFDGGANAWTRRGFKYKKANKRKLKAFVYIDADTHGYLTYQIEGGVRPPKSKKILVPTRNLKTNKYGNVTKSKREALFNNDKYFIGKAGSTVGTGVWEKYGPKGRKIRKVASLVDSAAYIKKFDMKGIVRDVVKHNKSPFFRKHLAKALRSAKK